MTKTTILRTLKITFVRDTLGSCYIVSSGSGASFRAFGSAVSEKAAKALRANIRKNAAAYGIE